MVLITHIYNPARQYRKHGQLCVYGRYVPVKRGTLEELPDDRKQDVREMQSPIDDCNS